MLVSSKLNQVNLKCNLDEFETVLINKQTIYNNITIAKIFFNNKYTKKKFIDKANKQVY